MKTLQTPYASRKWLAIGLLASSLARAQDGTQAPDPAPSTPSTPAESPGPQTSAATAEKAERIQVTGTRIRRTDVETSAPVTIIDREVIEKSGVISLGDVFRKSATSSPTGNFDGASGFVNAGYSTIDLLGLGDSRTLVLLNGKRLPTVAGLEAVNVDNIPVSLVERIEILAGGASAIYGADAVGGVVNIITKKAIEGTEISAFVSRTQDKGGEELEVTASQGISLSDGFSLLLSAGIRNREALDIRDRDLKRSRPERRFSVFSPVPGSWSYRPNTRAESGALTPQGWRPSQNCPADNQVATVPAQPNNVYCAGLRSNLPNELVPAKEEKFAALFANWELNPDFSTSLMLSYHTSRNPSNDGRFMRIANDPVSDNPLLLSRDRALELDVITGDVGGDFFELYAPLADEPERKYINSNDAFSTILSLEGQLGAGWRLQSSLGYADMNSRREGQKIFNAESLRALFVGNGPSGADPAYVPLDPQRPTADFLAAFTTLKSDSRSRSLMVDSFADTELASLPGGALSFGIGAAYSTESYTQNPDVRDTAFIAGVNQPVYTGTFADRGEGDRQMSSLFAEMVAPIAEPVDVELALRFDNYSDFGSTLNFGLGTKYTPINWLALRGRAASSFKAPPLRYIHQKGGGGYLTARDEAWCAREVAKNRFCDPADPRRPIFVDSPGNPNLDPETGLNYTAGFVLEPFQGFNFLTDYYWVNLQKTFQTDELQEIVDRWYAQNNGATSGTINENTVSVDQDGIIGNVGLPFRNLGKLEVRAVTSILNYRTKLGAWGLGWESQYFRMLSYKEQETDGKPLREQVGYYGIPAWRATHSLSLGYDAHNLTLTGRTIAGQSQDPELATRENLGTSVGTYNEYDAVYAVQLPWNGSLQLGVNNIRNTIGGLTDANAVGSEDVVSNALYSFFGRTYFARLTQRF